MDEYGYGRMTRKGIENLFEYHAPSPEMTARFGPLREAIVNAAFAINDLCPPGADRTAAIRKLKEAHMTANASIVLEGASYR